MTIPRFLRLGPKELSPLARAEIKQRRIATLFNKLFDERPHPWAPPAAKDKTRLQQFLARLRPSLSRETGIRLISLNIVRTHARTGRDIDLDWR